MCGQRAGWTRGAPWVWRATWNGRTHALRHAAQARRRRGPIQRVAGGGCHLNFRHCCLLCVGQHCQIASRLTLQPTHPMFVAAHRAPVALAAACRPQASALPGRRHYLERTLQLARLVELPHCTCSAFRRPLDHSCLPLALVMQARARRQPSRALALHRWRARRRRPLSQPRCAARCWRKERLCAASGCNVFRH